MRTPLWLCLWLGLCLLVACEKDTQETGSTTTATSESEAAPESAPAEATPAPQQPASADPNTPSDAPVTTASGDDATEAPLWLAPLFDPDARWQFEVHTTTAHWDDQDPAADPEGMVRDTKIETVTCKVAETRTYGDAGQASRVSCEPMADLVPLTGVWLAAPDGLYRGADALPSDADALRRATSETHADARFFAVPPTAVDRETESEDGAGESYVVTQVPNEGWCVERAWWGGDRSTQTLCLTQDGPTEGGETFSGGSDRETTFERAR